MYSSTSSGVTSALSTVTGRPCDVGQLELRPDVHLGGEGELLPVVQLGDLQVRLAEREDVVVLQRLAVQLRTASLTACSSTTPRPSRWSMTRGGTCPGRKPGIRTCLRDLPVGLVEAGLQLLERNLDGQLDPGRAELLDIGLHVGVTP